jgi:hypothetical protein
MDNYYNPQLSTFQNQIQQIQAALSKQPTIPVTPPQAISFVDGLNGAREYLKKMGPNSSAAVFDNSEAVFYTLSTDANGTPAPIKIGRFTLEDAPEQGDGSITKADLDAFKEEIRAALAAMAPKKREADK